MAIRKNAVNLTTAERNELTNAFLTLKNNNRYDLYVTQHVQVMSSMHSLPSFLSWHRQFLLELEQELQQAAGNNDLGLPYWHWGENAAFADPATYCIWDDDLMGGNGDPSDNNIVKTGPFRQGQWTIVDANGNPNGPLTRQFGASAASLPNQTEINNVLNVTPYDSSPYNRLANPSFRNSLEGWGAGAPNLHNLGHVWVGGSMLPMTSPNDPIFFLHHCFVDKLWADWMAQNPGIEHYLPLSGGPANQNLNDNMVATVNNNNIQNADVVDHAALGYTYDDTPGNCNPGNGGGGGGWN